MLPGRDIRQRLTQYEKTGQTDLALRGVSSGRDEPASSLHLRAVDCSEPRGAALVHQDSDYAWRRAFVHAERRGCLHHPGFGLLFVSVNWQFCRDAVLRPGRECPVHQRRGKPAAAVCRVADSVFAGLGRAVHWSRD